MTALRIGRGMMGCKHLHKKIRLKGEAEAEVAVAVVSGGKVPIRHPTVKSSICTSAATAHAIRSTAYSFGIALRRTTVIPIPILTPFPHIATHVVYPKLVWRFRTDYMSAVSIIPRHNFNVIASTIFVATAVGGCVKLDI